MYKLIIVDDEEIIRRGLSNMIEWAAMGFELVATFEDGSAAINYLQKNSIDVVLTDIMMGDISGLDVAKYANEHLSNTKMVIISGYRDFDYAKKAVEYNVVHYLLKPTQFDEVERVFKKIKQELDKDKKIENETIKFKERYKELIPILQEQFFINLLMGALNDEDEIKKRIALLDIAIDPNNDYCLLISFNMKGYTKYLNEDWEYGREKLDIAIKNFFNIKEDGINYFTILNYDSEIKVIALSSSFDDINRMSSVVRLQLNKLMKSIKGVMGFVLDLNIENAFNNIFELSKYKVPHRFDMITTDSSDKLQLEPNDYKELINQYKLFMSIIHDGDIKAVSSLVKSFIAEMEMLPINVIQHVIIDMFAVLTNEFIKLGTDIWGVTSSKIDYQQIVNMEDFKSIKNWCESVFIDIIEYLNKNKNIASDNVILKAMEYIDYNFHLDLSLDDVADRVFLNSVYFSRLFKQQAGENFTDYLTKIRMEKAIMLLKEKRYKTYEISEKVGYSNSKYFTRVFKQYTGYTTTEYLKLVSELGRDINE